METALEVAGARLTKTDSDRFKISGLNGRPNLSFTIDRELARNEDGLALMGIDHPIVIELIQRWKISDPSTIATAVSGNYGKPCILTLWMVHAHPSDSDQKTYLIPLGIDHDGQRIPALEKQREDLFHLKPGVSTLEERERKNLLNEIITPMLQRELQHRGIAAEQGGYATELIGWIETT